MKEIIIDSFIDTLKLIPFLFMAFLILEYIEHKMSKKNQQILVNNRQYGPFIGALLGAFPQCGFSSMATNLFSRRVITIGTLIAVYLSTSDEMLPILLSKGTNILLIIKILFIKIVIGLLVGLLVDRFYKRKEKNYDDEIQELCHDEHCHCKESIFKSSLIHTFNIAFFILVCSLALNILISYIGEENFGKFLLQGHGFSYFLSSLIGLIPNCASSVIITELYLENMISFGNLLSGLLTGSGIGILLLFRTNKNLKENLLILLIIYVVGVLCGFLIDSLGIIV